MGTGRSGWRPLWPILLVPLGVSLVVLFAGLSTRLFPEKTAKEAVPHAAEALQPEDDAAIRERALAALAKLALSTSSPAGPEEQQAGAPDQATANPPPGGAAGLGAVGGNAVSDAAMAESKAAANFAYDEIERRIAEQAKRAHVVIAVDSAMQVGRDYTASLIVEGGAGKDIAPLMEQTPEPAAVDMVVEIAPDAEAYASSSQFAITPVTPARQAIRAQAPTVWQWALAPRRDGQATLMIMLRQNVTIDGQTFSFPVKQFPQVIRVDLTWWLWLRELTLSFWGVVTALLVSGASGATIYNALRSRDGGNAGKPSGKSGGRRKPARGAA